MAAVDTLTALDIVVILLIVAGGVAGAARGFVTEVLSLLAWVAAFFAVRLLYPAGERIALRVTHTESGAAILAFAVIFLTTFIAFKMVAAELGQRTRSSVVGPVDRVLGLGFGAFKGLLFGAVIWLVLGLAMDTVASGSPRPGWLTASRTAPLLAVTAKAMVDFVEKRRHPTVDPAAPVLPPGHPAIGPDDGTDGPRKGYSRTDRSALDRLLDAGSKTPL